MTPDNPQGVGEASPRQIALLRDFRLHGMMAFFDSPFRLEGPGLREAGLIGGLGDSTAITAAGMEALNKADAAITRNIVGAREPSPSLPDAEGVEKVAGRVLKNCLACGDLISVRLADHKRGWGKFCDKSCSAAHKCGQRPRDVNAHHAKTSVWAKDRVEWFSEQYGPGNKPPVAPKLKDQIGKVKVKPIYHSPSECRECGKPVNGPGLCSTCDEHAEGMAAMEAGWDGHKVWTS